jgi:hypothetical protein
MPAADYIKNDMQNLIESLKWKWFFNCLVFSLFSILNFV